MAKSRVRVVLLAIFISLYPKDTKETYFCQKTHQLLTLRLTLSSGKAQALQLHTHTHTNENNKIKKKDSVYTEEETIMY